MARSNYIFIHHKIGIYKNWIIATNLTEQPPAAPLSHGIQLQLQLQLRPLPAPRDSHLCVVNALGLQEHQITTNNIYVFLDLFRLDDLFV